MRRAIARLALLIACVVALLTPAVARAHPLGNFTVNRYSRIEPDGTGVRVVYVLDMAEIPAFQEQATIDANRDGRTDDEERARYAAQRAEAIRRELRLEAAGRPLELRTERHTLSFPAGQAGLLTLRLEATYFAELLAGAQAPIELHYRDLNEPNRLGWREIVARPGDGGAELRSASVLALDQTDELRAYPEDLLSSPLDVREARLAFVPGVGTGTASTASRGGPLERPADAYAALASAEELTPSVILFSLVAAMALGALHALSPGHGKAVVAAYLVGARGTARHAMFLGATVTATHTAGVYALGLVTLYLSQYVLPERLYPVLEVVSGLLVIAIGGALFASRLRGALAHRRHRHGHDHDHPHSRAHHDDHEHTHAHGAVRVAEPGLLHRHGGRAHSHLLPGADGGPVSWKSLLALGVSGGLLPCPSALVVLLAAIALHRVAFGLVLIVAFSIGLAAVLVGIGLLLVYCRQLFQRVGGGGGLAPRLVPVASAAVIVAIGVAITAQALPQAM